MFKSIYPQWTQLSPKLKKSVSQQGFIEKGVTFSTRYTIHNKEELGVLEAK